ncbi:MAG: orotidine-5'-phosphate decarboxylase [Pseudomonadota bacterium]
MPEVTAMPDERARLIVALDVADADAARELVDAIGDGASFYKVGLELVMAGGLPLVEELRDQGRMVFLDVKLLDIGNTVERSVARAAETGANLLTIHGVDRKTVAAAAAGRGDSDMKILGVTVLTNLNVDDVADQKIETPIPDLVLHRAKLTVSAGGDGVVASALEASAVRAAIGSEALVVTPGIRLADDALGDQTRVATPASAIQAGASHIVVGRPITQADDPRAAAERFQEAIAAALSS